jgi:hypothetical protein
MTISSRALMVVYQAMELDGDKRAQLVQRLDMGAKWIFFCFHINMNEVLLWILGVDCIL